MALSDPVPMVDGQGRQGRRVHCEDGQGAWGQYDHHGGQGPGQDQESHPRQLLRLRSDQGWHAGHDL